MTNTKSPQQNPKKLPKTKSTKAGKSARKSASHQDKNPSPQEIGALVALFTESRYNETATLAQAMTERFPQHGFGWKALGAVFNQMGRGADALVPMQKAAALSPSDPEAHYNLGNTLQALGRQDEAETGYRRALQINPNLAEAQYNLGNILKDQGRLDAAEVSLRQALQIKPYFAEAHNNLSDILMDLGRQVEAEVSCRRALEIKPDYAEAHSNLLFLLNYRSTNLPSYCINEARQYGQQVRKKVASRFTEWSCAKHPERLRVGLVSGDFRNHPVGYFLESLLTQLDPISVELIAYPTLHKADELTARIKSHFADWKPIYGQSDEAAARQIHNDSVHVLIDLAGHTRFSRLPVFAWKPVPVQVSWLGYFATTGVSEIDYLLGDPYVAPTDEASHFTEKLWQLPECYMCFTEPDVALEVAPLPALLTNSVTFGCFNNWRKVSDAVVAVWARILNAVPGSRLFLKTTRLNEALIRGAILQNFAKHGITPDRLILEDASPRTELLASYHRVDIALDPFPYPGGTTSIEGLWMGVPVITKRGDRFLSHVGETIAHNAGLSDWIAVDENDYVTKAVAYASDLGRLANLRAGLRQQVLASPIFDATRFARHFEEAMWGMWNRQLEQRGDL